MHALVALFCFLNAVGLCKKREAELCELEEACEVATAKFGTFAGPRPTRAPKCPLVVGVDVSYLPVQRTVQYPRGKQYVLLWWFEGDRLSRMPCNYCFSPRLTALGVLHLLLSLPPVLSDQSVVSRNWSLMVVNTSNLTRS